MQLLHAGVDIAVIALWLGHERAETTQIYLHADMTIKQRALDRTTPPNTNLAAISRPIRSSLSSKRSRSPDEATDYAVFAAREVMHRNGFTAGRGIISGSA
jgi:hypothetical protein